MRTWKLILILITLGCSTAQAQSPAIETPSWRTPVSNTAHPALFRPASDAMVRDAMRAEAFMAGGRAWHLEVRTRMASRPSAGCRQCGRRVKRRANADLCPVCLDQWRASGVRGWDFPPSQ